MINFIKIIWDVKDKLSIGPIGIRYYSLMFLMAFLVGYFIMKKIYKREKINLNHLDPLLIYCVLGTLLGARLGHVFFYDWAYYKNHLAEILLPFEFEPKIRFIGFQGLASHGAAVGLIISLFIYNAKKIKKYTFWIFDRIVIPISIGGAFVRIGNLMNSEIIGKPTSKPWGFVFEKVDSVVRHPSQIYESISYIIIFLILSYMYLKTNAAKKRGLLFGTFLVLLWSIRFLIEFVKENQSNFEEGMFLNMGQYLSIPFVIIGIYIILKSLKVKRN